MRAVTRSVTVALALLLGAGAASADPCGMVPPVVQGVSDPIERVGPQRTYVFYKRGIETFVIRPGFRGKAEEFGMLIPFPTAPAIRKVPDKIFSHIAAAVDPPEVRLWVRSRRFLFDGVAKSAESRAKGGADDLKVGANRVRVLRREAVGMYEVAVLEAGSPKALSRWMDQHKFKYPKGMDNVVGDYVKAGWCFVAVKTRVGAKGKVNPRPGMRSAKTGLPPGGSFSGHVQGMGFRFKTDGLVVPMRLSAFNKGRLRNVVYVLSSGPKRIKKIPQKYVMRQLPGWKLYRNLTRPLPLRVYGGTFKQLSKWQKRGLSKRRNPVPHNGLAAELFASDVLAARTRRLSHPFEEREKSLLNIGEELGMRGAAIDRLNAKVLGKARKKAVNRALRYVKRMSLSVVDGDFSRDVISKDNLRFAWYRMPAARNTPRSYNARMLGPDRSRSRGVLYRGSLDDVLRDQRARDAARRRRASRDDSAPLGIGLGLLAFGLVVLGVRRRALLIALVLLLAPHDASADPCGMVPPVVQGVQDPIERVGAQRTYVFYKGGIETFVIRPGFRGKVSQFGMLIPFPTPPAIRKVPDKIFSHIAAAVDPPEVSVWVSRREYEGDEDRAAVKSSAGAALRVTTKKDQVRVLRTEAVGMYEVAVLEAGSAKALSRWMDQHKYKYPKGMDQPVNDYVKAGWCFVAVKTRVGAKAGVNPRPGMRTAKAKLPAGGGFTGHVQGMGFRFKTDGLVVPMRLSAFNKGRLRNIVYVLSPGPKRIKGIPQKYVMRQLPGWKIYRNLTRPLPLRVYGGTFKQLSKYQRSSLARRRNPVPHNGLAAELFAADLLAARSRKLSHAFEEREKALLDIGERLGLRGARIDALNAKVLGKARKKSVNSALRYVKRMSLTVVDGDFSRDVIAKANLRFAWYRMPRQRNNPKRYDARQRGPARGRRGGILYRGSLDTIIMQQRHRAELRRRNQPTLGGSLARLGVGLALGLGACGLLLLALRRRRRGLFIVLAALLLPHDAKADPCGMVPPVVQGVQDPIERVGAQTTYVFYKKGIETFVIRPGFRGKASEFGMLIPFPTPPAIRKVPDKIFGHIGAAIDPPEVRVWAQSRVLGVLGGLASGKGGGGGSGRAYGLAAESIRVLRKEAVGMYEVAVLAAGSAKALSRWMAEHKYKYPKGMDQPVNDYVKAGWCFVAVKTRVGPKAPVNPRPGMRKAATKLPAGGSWNGHVQGMGFRFKTDGLVVPMRLSAFNKGRLRNIVYVLGDGPRRIEQIPQKYVMRQLPGWKLYRNLTRPLPLRVMGGTFKQIGKWRRRNLRKRRDPRPHNGHAAELFASDILASRTRRLAHAFEEREKTLLDIGERLGLRGTAIDKLNAKALAKARKHAIAKALPYIKRMTLTVVDGDFSRDVIAKQNLRFKWFRMAAARNTPKRYNARTRGPQRGRQGGILYRGSLDLLQQQSRDRTRRAALRHRWPLGLGLGLGAAALAALGLLTIRRKRN